MHRRRRGERRNQRRGFFRPLNLFELLSALIRKFDDVFCIDFFHRPACPAERGFAQDAEDAEYKVFSFAVERMAKENQSAFIVATTICFYIKILFPAGMRSLLLSVLSAESNKKMILCVFCVSAVKIKHYT